VNDIWVCPGCKSINRMRDGVCYRCRAPRSGALETPGLDLRTENAAVERSVRSYVISWPLAAIAGVLLIGAAVLGLLILRDQVADYPALKQAFVNAISSGATNPDSVMVTQSVQIALLGTIQLGLVLLSLLTFAGWLALVTRNVPLLGGGTPARSPERVFLYALIPIWNLVKVPGMILDLLYRVDPREGGAFMVVAAWLGLVGSRLLSLVGGWAITAAGVRALIPAIADNDTAAMVGAFSDVLDQSFWLGTVVEVMSAVGTILLVAIMVRIELRCAARDGEIRQRMAASGAPQPPVGPAWDGQRPAGPSTVTMSSVATAAPVPPAASVAAAPASPAPPAVSPVPAVMPAPAPGPTATTSAPYEPNWPAGRPWPGSPGSASASAADGSGPLPPPPPPPDAPRLG
jgi:hypothetical protein